MVGSVRLHVSSWRGITRAMFDWMRRPKFDGVEAEPVKIREIDCKCCDTLWDYNHRHNPYVTYGEYFRWLERRVRALESAGADG